MKIAVIPARGGSKRVPRKNIKPFCGKPIIAWSIEAAHASGCFDRVVVSTDDEEIAAVSRAYGAEVPFKRPATLADDYTGTIPVIRHALQWFAANSLAVDLACCIYATAPFVRPEDLRTGLTILLCGNCDYAITVTSFPAPIQRALRIASDGRIGLFQPEYVNSRSQDLEPAYQDAGQFYWGHVEAWIGERTIFSSALPLILPRDRAQDIDTEEDWKRAEWLFQSAAE